jgi:hypothetical protein
MSRLALASLLLVSTSTLALPEVTEDHFIILTGSKDRQETERRLADLMKRWPGTVKLRPGFPQVMSSDGKKGLNPGFVIAVGGICGKRSEAIAVQSELRKTIPGVYVRAVARYLPGRIPDCPRVAASPASARGKAKAPKGYALQQEGPAGTGGLAWRVYGARAECGESVVVQLLDGKGALVDERTEEAHCVRGDPEVDGSGESKVWSAAIDQDEGRPARYVMLTFEQWASDTGCNGGVALCPTEDGIVEEELDGICSSSPYNRQEGETHCGR